VNRDVAAQRAAGAHHRFLLRRRLSETSPDRQKLEAAQAVCHLQWGQGGLAEALRDPHGVEDADADRLHLRIRIDDLWINMDRPR